MGERGSAPPRDERHRAPFLPHAAPLDQEVRRESPPLARTLPAFPPHSSECPCAIALAPESGWLLLDPTRLDTSRHMPDAAVRLPLNPATHKVIRARFPAHPCREGRGVLVDALFFARPLTLVITRHQ